MYIHEDDIPAQGKAEEEGPRFPSAYVHRQRQERSGPQARKGQEKAFRLTEDVQVEGKHAVGLKRGKRQLAIAAFKRKRCFETKNQLRQ